MALTGPVHTDHHRSSRVNTAKTSKTQRSDTTANLGSRVNKDCLDNSRSRHRLDHRRQPASEGLRWIEARVGHASCCKVAFRLRRHPDAAAHHMAIRELVKRGLQVPFLIWVSSRMGRRIPNLDTSGWPRRTVTHPHHRRHNDRHHGCTSLPRTSSSAWAFVNQWSVGRVADAGLERQIDSGRGCRGVDPEIVAPPPKKGIPQAASRRLLGTSARCRSGPHQSQPGRDKKIRRTLVPGWSGRYCLRLGFLPADRHHCVPGPEGRCLRPPRCSWILPARQSTRGRKRRPRRRKAMVQPERPAPRHGGSESSQCPAVNHRPPMWQESPTTESARIPKDTSRSQTAKSRCEASWPSTVFHAAATRWECHVERTRQPKERHAVLACLQRTDRVDTARVFSPRRKSLGLRSYAARCAGSLSTS